MGQAISESVAGAAVDRREHGGKGVVWWLMWMLVAVIVYVLSIGPVLKVETGLIKNSTFQAIYAPVFWLNAHSALSRKCFNWWVGSVCRASVFVGEK